MREHIPGPAELAQTVQDGIRGTDDLVEAASRFVEMKQRLGLRYETEAKRLRAFLRHLHERGIRRGSDLSLEAIADWATCRRHVDRRTWAGELSAVSVFLDHLKAIGKVDNNPCGFLKERWRSTYRPYIFSAEELRRIFAADGASRGERVRALVYFVIQACGLRVSEAARRKIGDFDREQGTLLIRETKFGKDRLLPLHPKVVERLRRYCEEHRRGAGREEPLIVNTQGRSYYKQYLVSEFVEDLRRLKIYRPTREIDGVRYGSPRLHALRHSFAVHRLLTWYREGADVQAKLPLLSTYLGHSSIVYTQVYLQIAGLLLREADVRHTRRTPDYLEADELRRLFQAVDPTSRQGFRDLTLLRYVYNTGSRISEVSGARANWLSLTDRPEVTIRGKGGKWRVCPLWPTTAEMLRVYLRQERLKPDAGYEEFLFITRQGTAFDRKSLWKLIHGYLLRAAEGMASLRHQRLTPHSLRHTTAVHLLQAGVEINVIKAWLGHADVSTTSQYLDLDLDKKREALERFLKLDIDRMVDGAKNQAPLPAGIVSWLERL